MSKMINNAKTTQATNNKQPCGVSLSVCVCQRDKEKEPKEPK